MPLTLPQLPSYIANIGQATGASNRDNQLWIAPALNVIPTDPYTLTSKATGGGRNVIPATVNQPTGPITGFAPGATTITVNALPAGGVPVNAVGYGSRGTRVKVIAAAPAGATSLTVEPIPTGLQHNEVITFYYVDMQSITFTMGRGEELRFSNGTSVFLADDVNASTSETRVWLKPINANAPIPQNMTASIVTWKKVQTPTNLTPPRTTPQVNSTPLNEGAALTSFDSVTFEPITFDTPTTEANPATSLLYAARDKGSSGTVAFMFITAIGDVYYGYANATAGVGGDNNSTAFTTAQLAPYSLARIGVGNYVSV